MFELVSDVSRRYTEAPVATNRGVRLRRIIQRAASHLPKQGPLAEFSYENPLKGFEDRPFEQALAEARQLYRCDPYWPERRYRESLLSGRISLDDLRHVLMDDLGDGSDEVVAGFGTRYTLRLGMLQVDLQSVSEYELDWLLAETDLLERFRDTVSPPRRNQTIHQTRSWIMRHTLIATQRSGDGTRRLPAVVRELLGESPVESLQSWSDDRWEAFTLNLLWRVCCEGIEKTPCPAAPVRPAKRLRDLFIDSTGEDTDAAVNEVLVRFCAAYLDQGYARWPLPGREQGFAWAFAALFTQPPISLPAGMRHMVDDLQTVLDGVFQPLSSIANSLDAMGVSSADEEEVICGSLLALRGWAGMIWQLETQAEASARSIPRGTLEQYLAIRLMLECHANADLGRHHFGTQDLIQIRRRAEKHCRRDCRKTVRSQSVGQRAYTLFQLAQAGGWGPQQLLEMSVAQWKRLVCEVEAFSSLQRRRIFHLAYERHFEIAALDAIAIHSSRRRDSLRSAKQTPAFTAIFCMDNREESFRRHLEEVDRECETESSAGFLANEIYYKGVADSRFRRRCPRSTTPRHFVREEPLFSAIEINRRRARQRHQIGRLIRGLNRGTRTLAGGWITGLLGAVMTVPMVARILAPEFSAGIRGGLTRLVQPPATELRLERVRLAPGPDPKGIGFCVEEMADLVVQLLRGIGMIDHFPPIVLVVGHHSQSVNNPHHATLNCAICGGQQGAADARALATMANDPRVRRLAADQGVAIPESTRFVAACHNTCSEEIDYDDLDLLPRSLRPLFRRIERSVNQARERNAHERIRRFESVPLEIRSATALDVVRRRSEDLAETRPESGHAGCSLLFVGRRAWSRGLFSDRRVLMHSYDPASDDGDGRVLRRVLARAVPVCAAVTLQYFFSAVDAETFGSGSKLPHNVTGLLGVMTGACSDLRSGLPEQMVEDHEPMRPLVVVETTPQRMTRVLQTDPDLLRLVQGGWIKLALLNGATSMIHRYINGRFESYVTETGQLPTTDSSAQWYRGQRGAIGFATIEGT